MWKISPMCIVSIIWNESENWHASHALIVQLDHSADFSAHFNAQRHSRWIQRALLEQSAGNGICRPPLIHTFWGLAMHLWWMRDTKKENQQKPRTSRRSHVEQRLTKIGQVKTVHEFMPAPNTHTTLTHQTFVLCILDYRGYRWYCGANQTSFSHNIT